MNSDTNVLVPDSERMAGSRVTSVAEAARMPVEGIWTCEYYGAYGWESYGIHVLENGRIIGGDNRQYFTGRYSVSGNIIKAEIVVHYYGPPRTAFGEKREQFQIELTGVLDEDVIRGQFVRPDRLQFNLECRLTKRMDLPAA